MIVTILHFLHVVITAHVYENDTFLTSKRVIFLRIYRKMTGSLFVFTAALDPPLTSKVNWIFFSKQCWHISDNAIYITFCFLDPDYNTARFNFQWRVRVIFQKSSLHRRLVIKLYNILPILEIIFTYHAFTNLSMPSTCQSGMFTCEFIMLTCHKDMLIRLCWLIHVKCYAVV